jgi:hypothetical protein
VQVALDAVSQVLCCVALCWRIWAKGFLQKESPCVASEAPTRLLHGCGSLYTTSRELLLDSVCGVDPGLHLVVLANFVAAAVEMSFVVWVASGKQA